MLSAIETFDLDGGGSIYHHIWHFWHGEDDTFDIRSLHGIEHCANIRKFGVASMVPSVDVALLTPLRHLAHLHIGVDVANIPALLDIMKLESVRVWIHWVGHYEQPPAFE